MTEFYADENGTKWLTAEEILAFPDEEDCEDYKKNASLRLHSQRSCHGYVL